MATAGEAKKVLTYRQLFETSMSDTDKRKAIILAYYKLRKHFEKIPQQEHTETWPETLMDLSPSELARAFERGQRQEYCPTAGTLWGFAEADRQEILADAWQALWRDFLRDLKRHRPEWKAAPVRLNPGKEPAEYRNTPPPVLDAAFEAALERAFGCKIGEARSILWREHPHFGLNDTREPSLVAQRLEERVKAVWMRRARL